jgi:hypothetical protein
MLKLALFFYFEKYSVSGIIIPRLLALRLVVPVIPGLVIFELITLLSQEPDYLTVLYEFLYQKPQGYAPLSLMTCLFMKIAIFIFIPLRRVTWYLHGPAKLQVSPNFHKNF